MIDTTDTAPETCEDRGYQCCDLTPPGDVQDMTAEGYGQWYDSHVKRFRTDYTNPESERYWDRETGSAVVWLPALVLIALTVVFVAHLLGAASARLQQEIPARPAVSTVGGVQ